MGEAARHRRLSQDRSGMPDRLQRTRIDAESVIETMIAESVQDVTPRVSDQGLALFVSRDGDTAVLAGSGVTASNSLFEKVQIAADSSPG